MKKMNFLFIAILVASSMLMGCAKEKMLATKSVAKKEPKLRVNAAGDLSDANIKYFGRWDFSSSTQYVSYWGGAYIKVRFTGTTVKVKVGNTSNFYAKIDNGAWVSYIGVTGTINLTPTALAAGTHSLSVAQGKDYDYVFNFQGLILDAGATTSAPSVGANLIEYIGDSITTGYTDPQANVSAYGWVLSESLGAEHTQISYPGINLTSGYTGGTGMDVQYFKRQSFAYPSSPNWNFATYTPKAIVINLGTNDNSNNVPDAAFQSTYTTFLANIRAQFPNAEIIVLRTFLNLKTAPTVAAVAARVAAGDNRVHYVNTDGWLTPGSSDYTDGLHPSVAGNIKVANRLKPILSTYITGGVTFYQDTQYAAGASQVLTVGNYTLSQLAALGMPNDWASSVRVPAGRTLIMYSDDNFTGQSWTRTSDTPDFTALSPSANDMVSSVKVQ
ncbi:endoglucanase [Mucilaginibacter limnophilus]|uniref:Endoglucanase n=1 Tax=Mucilaginibacter limnophilus TaxID=1932778 RepID=A0A3S2UM11_9SPHI|nr:GDSL-type esterase/lipase family protein [Mucilaginibacter limnophilus]RVU01024.1 endoglucanase [Mucilaginibacter limnophilus]